MTEEKQEKQADDLFEREQMEEIRARYDVMLKYFHDMTAKLQELKQENDDLKKKLKKASENTT
jgi:putative NADH-flavin reductase